MSSMHLVDQELHPLVKVLEAFKFDEGSLAATRKLLLQTLASASQSIPENVSKSEVFAPGPAGSPDVRVLVYCPKHCSEPRPAILNIHGGGYVAGSPEMQEVESVKWASELGVVVVAPDYRLAPETHFPGALEDCYAVLAWMFANASELNINPDKVAISGESAGGGLAAGLTLLARDRGELSIAFQHLIYPMLDDRSSMPDSPFVGQFVWSPTSNNFGWSCLLGATPGGPGVSPYASPARSENLADLPPAFIACGGLDFLVAENADYVKRLLWAGIPTEFHVYPKAPHGFRLMANASVSKRYEEDSISALRVGLGLS